MTPTRMNVCDTKTVKDYQICTRCIMDTTDRYIQFDEHGTCNHCRQFDKEIKPQMLSKEEKLTSLNKLIELIKSSGKGRKYDCLVGVSGGMDSSYVTFLAKKYGLRTLLFHFDNGWDSELAIKNIENIVKRTGFDYYNYVVDWEEFRDLQLSYFKASVVDIEVPTDQGIFSLLPKITKKFGIKYILVGYNMESESMMGRDWNFPLKSDLTNLLAIHREFSNRKLKTFPKLTQLGVFYYYQFLGLKEVNILNYAECNYEKIKQMLQDELSWREYGVKHGESTFTKFYQSYILLEKFGFDKNRAHLSNLICSGQITREEAMEKIKIPVYSDEELNEDYEYVLKKWQLNKDEFEEIMSRPIKSHYDYPVGHESFISEMVLDISVFSLRVWRRRNELILYIPLFGLRVLRKIGRGLKR